MAKSSEMWKRANHSSQHLPYDIDSPVVDEICRIDGRREKMGTGAGLSFRIQAFFAGRPEPVPIFSQPLSLRSPGASRPLRTTASNRERVPQHMRTALGDFRPLTADRADIDDEVRAVRLDGCIGDRVLRQGVGAVRIDLHQGTGRHGVEQAHYPTDLAPTVLIRMN